MLKQGAEYFKARKMYVRESRLRQRILDISPDSSLTDLFYANVAYYFAGQNEKGREIALVMEQKYPDEVFGYEWAFNNSRAMIDTVSNTVRDSLAAPDALKLLDFSQKDTVKYQKQLLSASLFLVDYYVNYAKDAVKALVYINKAINMDPANENYKNIRDQIEKVVKQQSNSGTWNKSRLDNSKQTVAIAYSRQQTSG